MQPLKHCQQAKQWIKDAEGMYHPCLEYPNCKDCPPKLSSDKGKKLVCNSCGAITMTLWEIDEPEKMAAPDVRYTDFEAVMRSSGKSFTNLRNLSRNYYLRLRVCVGALHVSFLSIHS